MSHDLKSPLRGISDLVSWIAEDLKGSEALEVNRNLGRISDRIGRLERVIDDLLAYAHAGTASPDGVSVELRGLIDGVLEILPRPSGIRVSVQIDAEPFRDQQGAAGKRAAKPGEQCRGASRSCNGKHRSQCPGCRPVCVFTISDDGPGIPAASQERVFRIFQTLAGGSGEHSGIGLALSKRLVETHGGWIKIESVEGVRGTSFHVDGRASNGGKRMTDVSAFSVLVVDDDDVAAEAVVRGLHKHGMRCPIVIAEDGHAALQILRGSHATRRIAKPYVVLLDLNMPRMNGIEFLRELRSDGELAAA